MLFGPFLLIIQALPFIQVLASTSTAPIVNLGYAQYQGAVDIVTNTTSFLGIRYATAPVGNLRWAAPEPPPNVSGIQLATTAPDECYQAVANSSIQPPNSSSLVKRSMTQSEDCLFVSVYTPGNTVTPVELEGLPVVVWIHGGGYITGNESEHNGAELVVESDYSVIAVIIQYRLGLFGFLAGEAVKSGGALNAGLLDQNFALQWVQSHISKFGGDPTKVVIWGISSGAGSVIQHVVANGGNTQPPLFKAAMTSSAAMVSQYNYNDPIPEWLYSQVVSGANCESSPDPLSCLRETDIDTLQNLNPALASYTTYSTYTFVPVVDGTFITERPSVTLGKGKINGEAIYSVTNAHEGTTNVNQSTTQSISQFILSLFPNVEPSQAAAAAPLYEVLGNNVVQATIAWAEAFIICPTYTLVEAFGSKAWKAEFAVPPAYHMDDENYYFTSCVFTQPLTLEGFIADIATRVLTPNNTSAFITAFSNSFMAMTRFLNPSEKYNASDVTPAQWNPWSVDHTEMMFNTTPSGAPHVYKFTTHDARLDRCKYWQNLTAYTAQ